MLIEVGHFARIDREDHWGEQVFLVLVSRNVKESWRETVRKAASRSLYSFHTVVLISVSRLSKIWRCTSGLGPTNDMACESCAKILRFARYLTAAQNHAAKTSFGKFTDPSTSPTTGT